MTRVSGGAKPKGAARVSGREVENDEGDRRTKADGQTMMEGGRRRRQKVWEGLGKGRVGLSALDFDYAFPKSLVYKNKFSDKK